MNKAHWEDWQIERAKTLELPDGSLKCETCGAAGAQMCQVPWGKVECPKCRERTGRCYTCRSNRNDCSC